MSELVIHPEHYNKEGRKECWEEMIEKFGPDNVAVFDCLNAFKYMYRAGDKDNNPKEQDMEKCTNYMRHAADLIASTEGDIDKMTKSRRTYRIMKGLIEDNDSK